MYSAQPNARRSDLAPQKSTGYDPTHWQTGLLASKFTTRSAASIRRRRHLREELESSLREEQAIAAQGKLIAAKEKLIADQEKLIADQEQLVADQEQLITTRLEAYRKSDAIRRALRHEENFADIDDALSSLSHPNKAIPAWIEQQPKKPEPKAIAPATGQVLESTAHARTAGAASAHDQRTEEVSQRTPSHLPITSIDSHIPPPHSAVNSSFALPLLQSDLNSSFALPPTHSTLLLVNDTSPKQPPVHHSVTLGHVFNAPNHQPRTPIDQLTERELSLVAEVNRLHAQLRRQEQQSQQPPPDVPAVAVRLSLIQTAASVSEGERDQAPTAAETETTNREHAVVTHAAPTPTNAASVAERTAQTPSTSSISKSPCDHARSCITKPMIEALWTNDSSPSPAPDNRANLNHHQPESKPTSTTSMMTTPYEAAKVPSPLGYHSRSTRGSSSNATAQSIHGLPTGLYHHHLSAEVSAPHSTTMDNNKNNNNKVRYSSPLSLVQPPDLEGILKRNIFDTND